MLNLPFVTCLCPTFRRPKTLQNAIACFLEQDYPAHLRRLLICDDDAAYESRSYIYDKGMYNIVSYAGAFDSLTAKYNAMAGFADGEVFAVWEDDEIYLPHHLSSHIASLSPHTPTLAKMSKVYSTYGRTFNMEDSAGRFHASLVFNRLAFNLVGGWPDTKRADFDQQFIQSFYKHPDVTVVDPLALGHKPSYVFRWESSEHYHGQSFMRDPADETWYARGHREIPRPRDCPRVIEPQFDPETRNIYKQFGAIV